MHVPEHISVTGEAKNEPTGLRFPAGDGQSRAMEMSVPERIMVAGGNEVRTDRAQPHEVLMDQRNVPSMPPLILSTPPSTLTLQRRPFPSPDYDSPNTQPRPEDHVPNSAAIEDNPLQELRVMRRQLGRLSARVYQLEADEERRRRREWLYLIVLVGAFAVQRVSGSISRLLFGR